MNLKLKLDTNYHVDGNTDGLTYRIESGDVEVKPHGDINYIPLELKRRYTVGSL